MSSVKRNTVQRQIVFEAVQKLNTHPTIDEIYVVLHREHPSISKTTVYRNLRQLADGGFIRQISLPDGLERYDRSTVNHYHFNCKNCRNIIDVEIEYLTDINDSVQDKYGFQVDKHDVVFSGMCSKCVNSK